MLISHNENGNIKKIYNSPIRPLTNHYVISIHFVIGKEERNVGYFTSLDSGVAAPGVYPLPTTIDVDRIAGWTHSQLVDKLVENMARTMPAGWQ